MTKFKMIFSTLFNSKKSELKGKKLFRVYYYTDLMMGYGVAKTIAYVGAENEKDALKEYSQFDLEIKEVPENELLAVVRMLKREVVKNGSERNEKLLEECLQFIAE